MSCPVICAFESRAGGMAVSSRTSFFHPLERSPAHEHCVWATAGTRPLPQQFMCDQTHGERAAMEHGRTFGLGNAYRLGVRDPSP